MACTLGNRKATEDELVAFLSTNELFQVMRIHTLSGQGPAVLGYKAVGQLDDATPFICSPSFLGSHSFPLTLSSLQAYPLIKCWKCKQRAESTWTCREALFIRATKWKTQISISYWLDQQNTVHPYNEIWLSHKKELPGMMRDSAGLLLGMTEMFWH